MRILNVLPMASCMLLPKRGYWDLKDVLERHFSITTNELVQEYYGDEQPFADIENHDEWSLEDLLINHADNTDAALACLQSIERRGDEKLTSQWEMFAQCEEHFKKQAGAAIKKRRKDIK